MATKNVEKNNILKKSSPSNKRLKICCKINKLIQKNKIKKKKNINEKIVIKKKNIEKNQEIKKKEEKGKKNKFIGKLIKNKKYKNDAGINYNNTDDSSKCTNIEGDILKDNLKKSKIKFKKENNFNKSKIKCAKKNNIFENENKIKLKKKKKKKEIMNNNNNDNTSNNNYIKDADISSFEEKFRNLENKKKLNKKFFDIEEDSLHIDNGTNKKEFSENFINFLKNYEDVEEKESKRNKNNNENDVISDDDYKYLSLKDDIYKVKNSNEKIDISDLIYSVDNSLGYQIDNDIKYLKNDNTKYTNRHLSVIEEQKINSSLAYIKNIETVNKFNKAYNIIQNSYQVQFGCEKEENLKSDEFLNKNILKKFNEAKKKNNNDKIYEEKVNIEKNNENTIKDNNVNNDDTIYDYDFEEEMKKNLKKSKMLIVSDDILKTEKEKKNEELKKIAQLKALLSLEHKKNAYKKRIKSKSYRKYLKIRERKEEEKILNKLYSEYPDIARDISNYEQEYAKKRNLINNVKKRKTVSLLNRYKNEELRKQILKSFQIDKEEKNMLKKIIEKTAIEENYHSYANLHSEINKGISHDNTSDSDNENNTSNEGDDDDSLIDEKKKKIKNELKKRNLLRFSFVKNAEEIKKNDEIYKKRKNMLNKIENVNEEKDCLSDLSSEKDNMEDFIKLKNEITKSNEKEVAKAKEQLKNDTDFLNLLKKGDILNMNNDIQDQTISIDETEKNKNETIEYKNDPNKIELDKHVINNNNVEKNIANELFIDTLNNKEKNDEMQNIKEKNNQFLNDEAENEINNSKSISDINAINDEEENKINNSKSISDINAINDEAENKINNSKSISDINAINDKTENDINNIKSISDINAINDENVLKKCSENIIVYNFEHNIYENYLNVNDYNNNKDNDELDEISDSERIKEIKIDANEWCNYDTLLDLEKKKIMKEKEIIEKRKNIPLHTINVLNKKDKKFEKYYIDKIPYPYNKNEYEKTLNININKEMNDISTHRKLISPQITNKIGNIISPLNKNPFEIANIFTLKKNKKKSKL
ncbi:conserved Plasmodium protein, unknown function [Plasmodium gallinaceum]|uniref:U3 small nucleolar RNA-associated protein 14 n=1 Tax=Plasmodium gallinaceum TaxID=5849 RepID=A0A1J1GL94_PLAGA|nr:conserved Plasmodium protein, unknown function [Plasmodium gallinaceum]CRG93091.1 conserved Plasmodium protein, unknown function [Plasmodium gallinaceum]